LEGRGSGHERAAQATAASAFVRRCQWLTGALWEATEPSPPPDRSIANCSGRRPSPPPPSAAPHRATPALGSKNPTNHSAEEPRRDQAVDDGGDPRDDQEGELGAELRHHEQPGDGDWD
jgi:hypothetical protein